MILLLQNVIVYLAIDDVLERSFYMSSSNKNKHLTFNERVIIETGIRNGSSKKAIADTLGKDKSTIGKEIKLHRILSKKCSMPLECVNYKKCKLGRACKPSCSNYVPFYCSRRDRSPGACNGCANSKSCHFNHYKYDPSFAEHDYKMDLVTSRVGINTTTEELVRIGNIIEPLVKQGLSPYAILQSHPEITLSERTIYSYIESEVFKNVGVNLIALDLRRQTSRKLSKKDKNQYKIRKDRKYIKNRLYSDYLAYLEQNPNANVVQMDTVYNDNTNGPFLQTFKFMKYSFTFIVYHESKQSLDMYNGILFLESILGINLFNQEVEVLITDRGSEFVMADSIETREDGSKRTRVFYCDPMCSHQKASLENNHEEVRYICPKCTNLYHLGLTGQNKANLITSNINSFPKEKLNGKTPFEYLHFMNFELYKKFIKYGIEEIEKDKVILKPYLLK